MPSDSTKPLGDPLVGKVLSCSRELLSVQDPDQLLRSALELARSRLGVDRCALWLLEPDGSGFRGTWGTGIDGNTTDERDRTCSLQDLERDLPCSFQELEGWVIRSDPHRLTWVHDGHHVEGRGWSTIHPVPGPDGNTGIFFQDSAIAEKPMDPDHQDLVALYCAILGQIARTRPAAPNRQGSDLARLLDLLEDLVACPSMEDLHRRLAECACELARARAATFLPQEPPPDGTPSGWIARQDGTVARRWSPAEAPPVPPPSGPAATWVLPLRVEGRRLGTIVLETDCPPDPGTRAGCGSFAAVVSRLLAKATPAEPGRGRAEKGRFLDLVAGGIAHDFNNLLTAALGNIELLLEVTDLDPARVRQRLEDARSACLRGRSLARQLLTIVRGGTPVIRPVEPVPFLMESIKASSGLSGLRWNLRNPDQAWSMLADEAQIGQVVQNLVVNACQWQEDEPTLEVVVTDRTIAEGESAHVGAGRYVQIDFQDGGPGVPESVRPRIFDPYFSTRRDGSGLGLATCRSILERHRGAIECAPSPRGALFRILLPATEADLPRPAPSPHEGGSGLGGRRILVMDDEPPLREMVRDILESQGALVQTAAEGRSAAEAWMDAALRGTPFDLGIFDLSVAGGLGGAEAARRILSEMPSARIIACSGYSDDPALLDTAELGFAGGIAKPFRMADLLDACDAALSAHGG